jgi:hypothetical protein
LSAFLAGGLAAEAGKFARGRCVFTALLAALILMIEHSNGGCRYQTGQSLISGFVGRINQEGWQFLLIWKCRHANRLVSVGARNLGQLQSSMVVLIVQVGLIEDNAADVLWGRNRTTI